MVTQPASETSVSGAPDAPDVSVVIPSYNSAVYVRECLASLRAQQTELAFEIILVDSSDDGANHIVAKEFPEVQLIHFDERRSVGAARNAGVAKARGDIVLFLDTDCVAEPNWVEALSKSIDDFGADGGGGSVSNGTPWSITGSVMFYLEFFRILAHDGEPRETPYLMGGNCGFRREVFHTARYADQSVGDDFGFNWQQLVRGRRLLFFPSVNIRHLNKTGFARVLNYQYKLGMGAYAYRDDLNLTPRIMRVLRKFPALIALMPPAVMLWVGGTVLRRRGVPEFLKCAALLPFLLVANAVWAAGFYRELRNRRCTAAAVTSRTANPVVRAVQDASAD